MSAFDFVAAIACGAIIGRVPNSPDTSYLQGAVTLVTILVAHRIVSRLRFHRSLGSLFDHPPRILIAHGRVLYGELRRAGITEADLFGLLRQKSITDLKQVRMVVFEQRGKISAIRESAEKDSELQLVHELLRRTAQDIEL